MATGPNHRIPSMAADSTSVMVPRMTNGNLQETIGSLKAVGIHTAGVADGSAPSPLWGVCEHTPSGISLTPEVMESGKMPDLTGMGARDAVFALQSIGLKAGICGAGRVTKQNIAPGTSVKRGSKVHLTLE